MSEKYKVRDQERPYFVTFAVEAWVDVFTRVQYKDVIVDALKFCQQNKGLVIYAWVIMTNHIHLIVGRHGESNIEEIIRDLKKYTSVLICRTIEGNLTESRKGWMLNIFALAADRSKKHLKYKFWQHDYHPIELSTNEMMDQKLNYLHDNPVKAGIVDRPEDYHYSSARDYCGVRGLIDVELIG